MRRKKDLRKKGSWEFQEAKSRLSEMVNEAMENGIQTVTKNGSPLVVVISHEEFLKLKKTKTPLGEFLCNSPFSKFDLEIDRRD